MLRTYVNIELVNLLTKRTLLIIRQIQDVFNVSRNKSSNPSVKAMLGQILMLRGLKGNFCSMLDSCSIDHLSIKIYRNQFFRSDFTPIRIYMFGLSFLTTLNIYKDHFKGRHKRHKSCETSCKGLSQAYCDQRHMPQFIFLFKKLLRL